MKSIKNIVVFSLLAIVSFGSFAQSVTATALTMNEAEAKIAAQAQQRGTQYKITEANTKNRVHMTAELYK